MLPMNTLKQDPSFWCLWKYCDVGILYQKLSGNSFKPLPPTWIWRGSFYFYVCCYTPPDPVLRFCTSPLKTVLHCTHAPRAQHLDSCNHQTSKILDPPHAPRKQQKRSPVTSFIIGIKLKLNLRIQRILTTDLHFIENNNSLPLSFHPHPPQKIIFDISIWKKAGIYYGFHFFLGQNFKQGTHSILIFFKLEIGWFPVQMVIIKHEI